MEATNLLNFYTQTKKSEPAIPVQKAPKPPSLKEALKLVTPKLLPYAMTLVGNLHDAEDLCQQTIMRLIENESTFIKADYPYAFAKKILRNTFIDKYRKDKREVSLDRINLEPIYEGEQIDAANHRDLMTCLKKHNETDRTILAMLGAGHSYEDIQRVLGKITMANLRVKTLRARKTLAECLGRNS